MKNKVNPVLLFITATLMLFSACSKQRIELNQYSEADEFMNTNKQAEQEFILDGTNGEITGNQGTVLWLTNSIFMDQDGNDVDYPITIKLVELYSAKDMILWSMPSIAQGNMLLTGGELRVRAFKDNEELILKQGAVFQAFMPSQNPDPQMSLFYGKEDGGKVDWYDNASSVSTNANIDALEMLSGDSAGFYELASPMMGWINCDRFLNSADPTTKITFDSEDDDLTHVGIFLYFPDLGSVLAVSSQKSPSIPVGASVYVLCFAKSSSGEIRHFYQPITVAVDQKIMVTMTEITEANLISLMEGF